MYKKIVLSSLMAGALLAVNGCGGGGSSTGTAVTSSKVSGVAVDDLIFNGVVTAKDTGGTILATGRTGAEDGRYLLNVSYTGVVLLNVICDENSTMGVDSASATICGSETTLNSLAAVEAGVDSIVNISPLTEVVYQRAIVLAEDSNISNIDADDVADARTDVGLMFSVDPLADDPTDGDYADIISAIDALATANDTTVVEITTDLAEALSDGEAEGEEIITDLVAEMEDENLTNNLTDTNGTYTPPEDAADLSDIDAAKVLFAELRTQAMSVTDYTNSGTPGFLDTEAVDMEQALNGVVLDISFMEMALNTQLDFESLMRDNNLTTGDYATMPIGPTRTLTLTLTGPSSYEYLISQGDSTWEGSVSYPFVEESDIYTFTTLIAQVDGTFPLGYESDLVPDGVENSQSFNGSITASKTSSGANFALNGEVASNGTLLAITNATAELAYTEGTADEFGNTEPVLNYFKFNGATIQGIVGGYTIDGSITVNSYVQNTGLAELGGIVDDAYSGISVGFSCPTSTLSNITNVAFTYDSVTYVPSNTNIYNTSAWVSFFDILGNVQPNEVLPNLDYTVTCSNGETPTIDYNIWIDTQSNIANSGWLPNDITFAGAISRTGASIEGTLNAKWVNAATMDLESDTEMPFVNVTLNGKLQMPESPEMLMTLSYENNATHNMLGASYTYETTVINAEGVFDADMINGDVAITTHTGLRADIDVSNGDIVYGDTSNVTKDGLLIGEFEDREGLPVVKYTDGSFESIF